MTEEVCLFVFTEINAITKHKQTATVQCSVFCKLKLGTKKQTNKKPEPFPTFSHLQVNTVYEFYSLLCLYK